MSKDLIGVIAEDNSDVDCIKHLVRKIRSDSNFGFKKFVGQGCGKISRKANAWAKVLKTQGCSSLILIHDLDRNSKIDLMGKLQSAINPSPIDNHLICIPVEEMEAWFLSDEDAFKSVFSITKKCNLPKKPESVQSPKEYIGDIVRKMTDSKVDYLNTKHNEKISEVISVDKIAEKCESFNELMQFVKKIKLRPNRQ